MVDAYNLWLALVRYVTTPALRMPMPSFLIGLLADGADRVSVTVVPLIGSNVLDAAMSVLRVVHVNKTIRQAFEAALQRVVGLGCERGERTPWASTVRTFQQLQKVADGLWTFLEIEGIEPTNNAAKRGLRQSVIQHKSSALTSNSHGAQSRQDAICLSRLLTVTTTLRQQGGGVWEFLEQAWIAHHRGGVMTSLMPDH